MSGRRTDRRLSVVWMLTTARRLSQPSAAARIVKGSRP